eukprot:7882400-Pyramimonas_sp.AAC.1
MEWLHLFRPPKWAGGHPIYFQRRPSSWFYLHLPTDCYTVARWGSHGGLSLSGAPGRPHQALEEPD